MNNQLSFFDTPEPTPIRDEWLYCSHCKVVVLTTPNELFECPYCNEFSYPLPHCDKSIPDLNPNNTNDI